MSFFDDASLVFLPSGEAGKDGKAYSMKPTDGSGDFTFSRGSNLTATRVDSNGLIEKGRENLLTYSNEFATSPWGVSGLETPTTGESGYDGSADAWLLETSASSGRLRRTTSLSGVNTFSFYAKKGNVDYIAFFGISSGNFPRAWFNLATGNVSNQLNHIDAKMEIIGNGWYRCSITFDEAVTELRIYPTNTAGSFSAGAGETSIIQDAQLEIGLVATEYIESGASKGKAGILEHSPRFDYSGGASCPSLLLEPSRTNLIGYSEYLEGTGWTAQAGITLTPNTTETLSPEGLNNAYKVVSTDATKGFYISGLNVTNDAVRTIYLKGSVGGETIVFKDPSGFGTPSTKTLTTDWQRFEMATTNDGNTYQGLFIDDISVGTIYAYGAQVELGSYPTSYIPNHSGGSETRNADVCEGAGTSSTFNDSEGVLYVELSYLQDGRLAIKNSDSSDQIVIGSVGGNVFYRVKENNTNVITEFTAVSGSVNKKIALRYKSRDTSIFIDGVEYNVNTSNYTLSGLNEFLFVSEGNTTYGNVKQVLVFGTALSDSECITLTS